MKYTREEKQKAFAHLKEYKTTLNDEPIKLLVVIKSISQSGMCRRISVYTAGGHCLNHLIAPFLEWSYNDKGIRVTGCGMDMVYHLLSTLNYAIASADGYKEPLLPDGRQVYDAYWVDASRYILL